MKKQILEFVNIFWKREHLKKIVEKLNRNIPNIFCKTRTYFEMPEQFFKIRTFFEILNIFEKHEQNLNFPTNFWMKQKRQKAEKKEEKETEKRKKEKKRNWEPSRRFPKQAG